MEYSYKKLLKNIINICILLCFVSLAHAQNKVVVVPLFGDAETANDISNVVTMALEGGDFTGPLAAMNSIDDASEDNPYLIAIAPGIYPISQTLVVKDYVGIVGSGQSNTKIINTNPNTRYTLEINTDIFNLNFAISDITIENSSGGLNCGAVSVDQAIVILTDVILIASECTSSNVGLNIELSNGVMIQNSKIIANGGRFSTWN